jgi:predicted component of type VI protein secretion system
MKQVLKSITLLALTGLFVAACSSNQHKAEKIETAIEKREEITGDTALGVKEGNMVVQKKVRMNEELRSLQNEVYSLEDRVYGNRQYGSLGLYGVLRQCKADFSDRKNGGDGKLMWTEPVDRVTDKEDEFNIGVDEKDKIVGVKEEFLKDRIARFKNYRNVLEKRQDEYETKLAVCQADLKSRKFDAASAAKKSGKQPETTEDESSN